MTTFDFAVIGAGIAGASVAAKLAPHASVVLLEAEDVAGYHSTGRSAANWHETLGGPKVQPLTKASFHHLEVSGFLRPRITIEVADSAGLPLLDQLDAEFTGTGAKLRRVDADELAHLIPRVKPVLVAGLIEEDCADIDVGALHAQYMGNFKRAGGTLLTDARVLKIGCDGDAWKLQAGAHPVGARVLINAAGGWADQVAELAGVAPIGIQPTRRTIAQIRVDGDIPEDHPFVIDVAGEYYFRPEGHNRFWVCPHDETPVEPHDVAPEELDIAIAIYRFETVTDWRVVAVERKWAGLRSFAPDRLPVYGYDPVVPNFFWCAGQGGYGIQTAPAAAELCAALLLDRTPDSLVAHIDPSPFSPSRFGSAVRKAD
jgi:D-arginine dehydrogenase